MQKENASQRPNAEPENPEPPGYSPLHHLSAQMQERRREKRANLSKGEDTQENLTARYWG